MSEEKQENRKIASKLDLSSKYMKTLLVLIAVFLIFVGPTYTVYILINVLEINYAISMLFGFALFIVGLALLWYLIRNKVIS